MGWRKEAELATSGACVSAAAASYRTHRPSLKGTKTQGHVALSPVSTINSVQNQSRELTITERARGLSWGQVVYIY